MSFIEPHSNPGKAGTFKGFFLLMVGILASIITLSYPNTLHIPNFTSNCPDGYVDSCQVVNIVLRYSFALVILVNCIHKFYLFLAAH